MTPLTPNFRSPDSPPLLERNFHLALPRIFWPQKTTSKQLYISTRVLRRVYIYKLRTRFVTLITQLCGAGRMHVIYSEYWRAILYTKMLITRSRYIFSFLTLTIGIHVWFSTSMHISMFELEMDILNQTNGKKKCLLSSSARLTRHSLEVSWLTHKPAQAQVHNVTVFDEPHFDHRQLLDSGLD